MRSLLLVVVLVHLAFVNPQPVQTSASWIRINQLGYRPDGIKGAVWCSNQAVEINFFQLCDASSGKSVYRGSSVKAFGAYGPFSQTYRIDFSEFNKPGRFFLRAG